MQIAVGESGLRLWDYDAREFRLVAPPGIHEVIQVPIEHLNNRTAIVIAHPEQFGGGQHDRAGVDEENLRRSIAAGTANVTLID